MHESASVATLDGTQVRYLARSSTRQVTAAHIRPGTQLPAYATSMGRVLLADLSRPELDRVLATLPPRPLTPFTRTSPVDLAGIVRQAKADGYTLVEQELEVGLRSMAVPVRDPLGNAVAALNLALHAGPDTPQQSCDALLPHLRATARAVEADLAAVFAFAPVRVE